MLECQFHVIVITSLGLSLDGLRTNGLSVGGLKNDGTENYLGTYAPGMNGISPEVLSVDGLGTNFL